MDVVSAVASLLALLQAASQVVDYLSDLKDGGRERIRLLAEVSSFYCVLENLKELLENDSSPFDVSDNTGEKETERVRHLLLNDSLIEQCDGAVSSLVKRLAPIGGKGRLIRHLLWPFSKAEVLQTVEQLHRLQTIINNYLSQAGIVLSQQIRHDGAVSRQILEDHEARAIRDWLSPLDFAAQQEAICASHCPGTGTHFLESEKYKLWKSSDRSVLWCRGVPGAGKTYLSSIVIHNLQQELNRSTDIALVVYCRYDDPQCQNITYIAGDLLRQCIRDRQVPQVLAELFRKHRSSEGDRPTNDVLFSILSQQLASYRKAYIVVDALDEIAVSDDRRRLLETLRSTPNLSLMVASRDFEDIRLNMGLIGYDCDCCVLNQCSHCGECPRYIEYLYHCGKCAHPKGPTSVSSFNLCQKCYKAGVRCLNGGHWMEGTLNCMSHNVVPDEDDLKHYLRWRVACDSSLRMLLAKRKELQDQVFDAVVRSSGSMFLMAKLIMDGLATCLTVKELKSALADVPSGLTVAYDATMQRIISQGPKRTRRAFEVIKWVLLAKWPLTSADVEHLVSIEQGSEDIDLDDIVPATTLASLCAGLVVITGSGSFSFMHKTVPDYLRSCHSEKFLDVEAMLGDKCLTYITYRTFAEGPCRNLRTLEARCLQYPAYSYCSRYWYEHIQEGMLPVQKQAALEFLQSETKRRAAAQVTKYYEDRVFHYPSVADDTILHYATFLGAYQMFDDLLRFHSSCLNTRDSEGDSPLIKAARHGYVDVVTALIAAGADLEVVNNQGNTAFYVAAAHGHIDIVRTLITVGVDPNTVNSKDNRAVHVAAAYGYIQVVSALISAGADLNIIDRDGYTALHVAAAYGYVDIVTTLITAGADMNITNHEGYTVLHMAVANGFLDIVTSLVTARMALDITNNEGNTALHIAAIYGHTEIVAALITARANLTKVNSHGDNALHIATVYGHAKTVATLITEGAHLNIVNSEGNTALHVAAAHGHVEIVTALITARADLDKMNGEDDTALHVAARYGNVDVVAALITAIAGVDMVNWESDTPLHVAARHGHVEVVTALITAGAVLNMPNSHGGTALHVAVESGHTAVVEALVTNGMDVDLPRESEDSSLRLSAVMLASLLGHIDILDIVLKHSRDVNHRRPGKGRTALMYATMRGDVMAVRLLLSQQTIKVDVADMYGATALTHAAFNGIADVIPDLVTHGANLNLRTDLGETPIKLAAEMNYTQTAKALLSFPGVDVNAAPPSNGCGALHHAVSWGNAELVELLIAYGADIQMRDKTNGFTPLDYARYFNDRTVLGLFQAGHPENSVPSA